MSERTPKQTQFSRWLTVELASREMPVRGLARRIADQDPRGASERNIETIRRALHKYLREGRIPSRPMRDSIAIALGVASDEVPDDDDSEDDVEATLQRMTRDLRALRRRVPLISSAPLGHENNPDEGVYD